MTEAAHRALQAIVSSYYRHVTKTAFRLDDPRPTGYHYTNEAAASAILQSGVFRCTNVAYMNDPAELEHSIQLMQDAIQKDRVGMLVRETPAFDHLREHVIPKLRERSSRQFVLSLSLAADCDHLWSTYAGPNGYALQFDIPILIEAFRKNTVLLRSFNEYACKDFSLFNGKVLYKETIQRKFIADSIDFICRLIEAANALHVQSDILQIAQYLTEMTHLMYAALYNMKSEAHSREPEYRFVILPDPGYADVLSRRNNGRDIPYIEVKGILSALTNLWIGPQGKCSPDVKDALSRIAAERSSDIPVRQRRPLSG